MCVCVCAFIMFHVCRQVVGLSVGYDYFIHVRSPGSKQLQNILNPLKVNETRQNKYKRDYWYFKLLFYSFLKLISSEEEKKTALSVSLIYLKKPQLFRIWLVFIGTSFLFLHLSLRTHTASKHAHQPYIEFASIEKIVSFLNPYMLHIALCATRNLHRIRIVHVKYIHTERDLNYLRPLPLIRNPRKCTKCPTYFQSVNLFSKKHSLPHSLNTYNHYVIT